MHRRCKQHYRHCAVATVQLRCNGTLALAPSMLLLFDDVIPETDPTGPMSVQHARPLGHEARQGTCVAKHGVATISHLMHKLLHQQCRVAKAAAAKPAVGC